MKLSTLMLYIPFLLSLAGMNAPCAAHDGTVNVLGKIIDATCTVATDSKTLTVPLGSVPAKQFTKAGDGTAFQAFSIDLEKCPAVVKTITVHFEGAGDSKNTDLLALTNVMGVASGVGIGIYNSDRSMIPFGKESAKFTPVAGQTTLSLNFYARYVANGNAVVAGPADASATFVLTYA